MTEQHTPGTSPRYLDSALDEIERLKAEKAELLAALKVAKDQVILLHPRGDQRGMIAADVIQCAILDQIDTAIAKARG